MAKINPWRMFRLKKRDDSMSDYYASKDARMIRPTERGMRRCHRSPRTLGGIPEMTNE